MTDKELLELAAKAAGFEIFDWYGDRYTARKIGDGLLFGFNPLTDDGDALRLAVKLRLLVGSDDQSLHPTIRCWKKIYDSPNIFQLEEGDPYAATRQAIVRAAAEIGRAM